MLLNDKRTVVSVVFDYSHVPPVCVLEILVQHIVLDEPIECVQYSINVDFHLEGLVVGVFTYYLPRIDVVSTVRQLVAD